MKKLTQLSDDDEAFGQKLAEPYNERTVSNASSIARSLHGKFATAAIEAIDEEEYMDKSVGTKDQD